MCLKIYDSLRNIIDGEYVEDGDPTLPDGWTLPPGKWRRQPTLMQEFNKVTGFVTSVVESARKDIRDTNGYILGPDTRGRKPLPPLEQDIENLEAYLVGLVNEAKKGGFLTVGIIREKIFAQFSILASRRRVRKALRRLGFRYAERRGIWLTKRESYGVICELWEFCCFVKNHVVKRPDGRYAYVDGVSFVDESHIYSAAKRKLSWIKGADRFMEVADRAGSRINIFDGILSDKFTTGTRKSWSSNATTGEYHGKYTTSDTVCKYMSEEIFFHMDTGQHAFVDHASVHMMFKEDTRKMTVEGLMDWVTEQQDADLQILFNNKYEAEGVAEMNQTATRAWLMNWIRDNDLRKRKLVELGKQYDIHVHFLPTGWFLVLIRRTQGP
jgi:hypothetical protein